MSWSRAFRLAEQILLEGELEANLDDNPVFRVGQSSSSPSVLAEFIAAQLANGVNVSWMNGGLSCIETESTLAAATPVEETKEAEAPDNLSRQLCRQWLKFRYLKVGQACGESCKRCHILPASLGQMYSDYAFKGLSKVQRKTIFDAVEKERQTPASLPRADLEGEPSHQPEGGAEPGKRKEVQVTGAPFRKRSKIA